MTELLTREQLLERLSDSLRVIELCAQLYDAGEPVVWMPVATELFKLLLDDPPLVPELFPDLRFHPLRDIGASSDEVRYLLLSPGFTFDQGQFSFNLMDFDADKIPVKAWLQERVAELKGQQLTVRDFVILMRHNISAHTSRKVLGGKAGAVENFASLVQLDEERPACTRILVDLALYVVKVASEAADREPGPSLALIRRSDLLEMVHSHNSAKNMMDEMVQVGKLPPDTVTLAIEKLEAGLRLLIPHQLNVVSRLLFTHLGEAYRFGYLVQSDPKKLFKAIAAVELLSILADDAAPCRDRALIAFNIAQMYRFSSRVLGRVKCWRISLAYYKQAMELTMGDEDSQLFAEAAQGGAQVALRLFRIREAIRLFRAVRLDPENRPA